LYLRPFVRNALILIVIVSFAGCAYVPTKTKPTGTVHPNHNLTMLMARFEENQGNWAKALELYSQVKDPFAMLSEARVYFIMNDNDDALSILQKVIDEGTYTGEALEMRTKIHARSGNWQQAIVDTESLVKKYPDNSQIKLFLANLKIITGDFKEARSILQSLIGSGDDSIIYYTIAKTCMGERNFKCVKDNLKKAIDTRADFAPAYLDLAKTYDLLGEPAEALKVYQKLLDVDPLSSDAHLALVDHYIQQKHYKEAISHLKSFLEITPDNLLLRKLIVLELQEGLYNDALALIKGLKEMNDDDKYYLSLAYAGLERYDDALTTLKEISPSGRLGCDVVILKASILKNTGKINESVAALESAWKDYADLDTCNEIGYQLATEMDVVGRRDEGLAIAMKLLQKDPHDPVALNFVGYVWADRGSNLEGAHKMIKEALEMKPDDPFILDSMGWVLFRMGKSKEALLYMEKALKALKDDPVINEHMGDILKSLGKNEKALDYYLKSSLLNKSSNKEVKEKINALLHQIKGEPK
jgi:tetratricopeptide (TPR) repeat protein